MTIFAIRPEGSAPLFRHPRVQLYAARTLADSGARLLIRQSFGLSGRNIVSNIAFNIVFKHDFNIVLN